MSDFDFETIKTESDMINLSQGQLLAYYTQASSLVLTENSTIQGLDVEIIKYQSSIDIAELELEAINASLRTNAGLLAGILQEGVRLRDTSSILGYQIISTSAEIQREDSIINKSNLRLSTLNDEYSTLTSLVFNAEKKFEADATHYSSLYMTYLSKRDIYTELLRDITFASTTLESTTIGAIASESIWKDAYRTLKTEESLLSSLYYQEIDLFNSSLTAEVELNESKRILKSTIASYDYYSSLYTTAVLNSNYVALASTQKSYIDEASLATQTYNDVYTQYTLAQQGGMGTIDLNLVGLYEQASTLKISTEGKVKRIASEVERAKTDVDIGDTIAYETLLAGYDARIADEYSSIYHYRDLRDNALNVRIPYHQKLQRQYLTEEGIKRGESTFWGEAYVSTQIGYTALLTEEADLLTSSMTLQRELTGLDSQIMGYKKRIWGNNYTFYDLTNTPGIRRQLKEVEYQVARPSFGVGASGALQTGGADVPVVALKEEDYYEITADELAMKDVEVEPSGVPEIDRIPESELFPLEGYLSSMKGYISISTIKTAEALQADILAEQYNDQYVSISKVLYSLNADLSREESKLEQLSLLSSIQQQEVAILEKKAENDSVEILSAFNEEEKAAYEYRESYVRQLRLILQNTYDDQIKQEIQRASTLAANQGMTEITTFLNLEQPDIRRTYDAFQNVTSLLGDFDTLYQKYDDRGKKVGQMLGEYSNYNALLDVYTSNVVNSVLVDDGANFKGVLESNMYDLSTKDAVLNTYKGQIEDITADLEAFRNSINENFKKYFLPTKVDEINEEISSFLREGYVGLDFNAGAESEPLGIEQFEGALKQKLGNSYQTLYETGPLLGAQQPI